MTIGVQGEWGSGKTSLLNQIWNDLDDLNKHDDSIDDFKQIWINSWEHSLLCSPEECLMKIINEIILEIASSDISKHRTDSLKKSINTIMKGALRIGSSVALGTAGVDAVDSVFSDDKNSIKELRNQLKELISDLRKLESNNYGKIVIYIDDLIKKFTSAIPRNFKNQVNYIKLKSIPITVSDLAAKIYKINSSIENLEVIRFKIFTLFNPII